MRLSGGVACMSLRTYLDVIPVDVSVQISNNLRQLHRGSSLALRASRRTWHVLLCCIDRPDQRVEP